jgi:single-stranded-DNA-specific exonuclease
MRPSPPPEFRHFAARLGVTPTIGGWLYSRGHRDPDKSREFLDAKLRGLTPPEQMLDREAAALRIARAIRNRERVAVFGDYDCDGITSAAIVTETIRALGGEATPLLASRFDGGYGVSAAAVERIVSARPALLVTCDCGSSDHESLRALGQRGIDVVVIDHHLVPEQPLPALAFLNPHRPGCGFAYKGLASCGLALSIAAALRKELGVALDVRRWLDLVAIGTIADVAPLDGDNRALVKAGLLALRTPERPGLRALLTLAKFTGDSPLTARDVAFRIAPQLNAPGRLAAPDLALRLLLCRDDVEAQTLAREIEEVSGQRREQQTTMFEEAVREIEEHGYAAHDAIVVGRAGWNPGVVGIVAGRLAEQFAKPTVVIGFEGAVGRGSVRGPKGAQLHSALSRVKDCLERFGGHQAAAGLEVRLERLAELRERFGSEVRAQPFVTTEDQRPLIALESADDPLKVLFDLDRLEPCGAENPRPRVQVEGTLGRAREVKGAHLKVDLVLDDGRVLGGFFIGNGALAQKLHGRVVMSGDLRHTSFPGSGGVEMFVDALTAVNPA